MMYVTIIFIYDAYWLNDIILLSHQILSYQEK